MWRKSSPRQRKLITVVAPLLVAAVVGALVFATQGGGAPARVRRCTERIISQTKAADVSRGTLKRYVERGYCRPFDRRGWVYADGRLKLEAYTRSGKCSESAAGGRSRPVPCEQAEHGILDCGLLRFVRRREAQRYIARLRSKGPVECDDQTPLEKIGA